MMKLESLLGSHVKKRTSVLDTVQSVLDSSNLRGCQIFSKSPQSVTKLKRLPGAELDALKKVVRKNKFNLYIHSQYILNICRRDRGMNYQVSSVSDDMKYIGKSCRGVILHTGSDTKGVGAVAAFNNAVDNIHRILEKATPNSANLILETTVRTKNDVCDFWSIQGLARLYHSLDPKLRRRVRFCIDTCHIYASGYDIGTPAGFKGYIREFDKAIGVSKIELFHLNDSKFGIGSGKDRHQILLQGKLFGNNKAALKAIINFCVKNKIKMVSETSSSPAENELIVKNIM